MNVNYKRIAIFGQILIPSLIYYSVWNEQTKLYFFLKTNILIYFKPFCEAKVSKNAFKTSICFKNLVKIENKENQIASNRKVSKLVRYIFGAISL